MKNTLLIIILLALGITACEPFNEPEARFDVSSDVVLTYEDVYFYNNSRYANEYEWSFGDGDWTNSFQPIHYYSDPGYYQVRLSAYNHDQVSDAYMTINVIEPATLDIQVQEYYSRNPISNIYVRLYPSKVDWENYTNEVAGGYTDNYGVIVFNNLYPGIYYMDISNRDYNNYQLANDDINFITTPQAISGSRTIFTAYVDYVGTKSAVISRKIVPSTSATKRTFDPQLQTRTK